MKPVFVLDFADSGGHFPAAGEEAVRELVGAVRDDVLLGGEDVDEFEVLVDHADTGADGILWGGESDRFAEELDGSGVGAVDSGEDVHEC